MPLNTQILRNGETLKLKWTDFHVAAMVCASSWDAGKGPFENNTPKFKWGGGETIPKEWRGKDESLYPEVPCPITPYDGFKLAMYHVIGATPLNNGPYTLKKKHKFVDTTDSEVLELLPGDVLKAWRSHK